MKLQRYGKKALSNSFRTIKTALFMLNVIEILKLLLFLQKQTQYDGMGEWCDFAPEFTGKLNYYVST